MIYQKPLEGASPYAAHITSISAFPLHRHYEVELIYCLCGSITADINGEKININKDEMLFVGSFTPHAYEAEDGTKAMVVEFGHALLKEDFSLFTKIRKNCKKYDVTMQDVVVRGKNIAELLTNGEEYNPLELTGMIYLLGAAVIKDPELEIDSGKNRDLDRISPALRLIHLEYSKPVSVEDACRETSLSPGNFCTLFKKTVGMGFHTYLNLYRIQNAGQLLKQTGMSISEVSSLSGFSDIKTFYRVFKKITGKTPKEYRES